MKEIIKSPNQEKWVIVEVNEDRYVQIPDNFIGRIHLDNERNITLKSNNNVWFFEIRDKIEENLIFEKATVHVDLEWGFNVPLMNYQLKLKPKKVEFVFFDDNNGIGCGDSATYSIWATGKLNRDINENLKLDTYEETTDYILEEIRKIRGKNETKSIR